MSALNIRTTVSGPLPTDGTGRDLCACHQTCRLTAASFDSQQTASPVSLSRSYGLNSRKNFVGNVAGTTMGLVEPLTELVQFAGERLKLSCNTQLVPVAGDHEILA